MRKTKKALASLAIAGMVLSMAPMSVLGATTTTRLAGNDRIQTAIAVAGNGWTTSDNVIVVPADDANIVDALAAAPLAGQLNAPILVTYKGALDPAVQQEIVNLKAKNVYAVGALSADTVASLKAISGVNVTALQGADRTETAAKVAAQLTNIKGSFVVAYNGVADAMSAASYAAANGYSILVENPDATLPANEAAYKGAKQYTVGGQAKLDGATALSGADRYATNDAVVKGLDYKYDTVYVANGESLVDALAGAPLAAKTNSAIVLANATQAATGINGKVTTSTQVIALGGVGAVPEAVRASVGQQQAPSGPVSVQSVTATSASTITVKFSAAPADTSKVTFNVTNTGASVSVTPTWDATKTVATLTGAANFPEATYTVAVKNDTTDLGSNTVSITQQKIAKINITSTKLAVTQDGTGYAAFTVADQYGNDITGSYLANNIQFQTGVGQITSPSTGVLKVTTGSGVNLLSFSTVVITGYDSSTGVSTSATLATSTAMGTLSGITLNKLTNDNNAVLTAGDTTDTWYIDYSAKDISGVDTKDYNLVKNGLILTGTNNDQLSCSNPDVTVKLVHDTNDSNKAALQVTVDSNGIQMDMPVTITAMSYQGAPSSLSLTLKKQAAVDSFTLMAPSYNVASGELKQIPFVAYDQNGSQMTKFTDLNNNVTLTGFNGISTNDGGGFVQNPDGTASLWVRAANNSSTTQSTPQVLSAVTKTGKLSTVTLNIQPTPKANALTLDTTKVVSAMQEGANERFDFGLNYGGFTVNDQYGRAMDMTGLGGNASLYEVVATTTGGALNVDTLNHAEAPLGTLGTSVAYGGTGITVIANTGLNANTNRTQTVNFYLIKVADQANVLAGQTNLAIDSKSVTFSVVQNSDITAYTIDAVTAPIYASVTTPGAITAQNQDWGANPYVYGKTSSGSKVMLATTQPNGQNLVQSVAVDNTNNFTVNNRSKGLVSAVGNAYDTVRVLANQLDASQTSASTNLTVSLFGADNLIHTVSTAITSSNVLPVAKSLNLYTDASQGMHMSDDGTTLYLDNATGMSNFAGALIARENAEGSNANRQNIWFYTKDSYGKKATAVTNLYVVGTSTTNATVTSASIVDGVVTTNLGSQLLGSSVTVTGVTANGLALTIKVVKNY